jgi:hypothetical protein
VGIAYNLSNAMFAGTAPLIQTALVMRSHGNPESALMVSDSSDSEGSDSSDSEGSDSSDSSDSSE